jgi:hypothetical protein
MSFRAHAALAASTLAALSLAPAANALILNGGTSMTPETSYVGAFNGGTAVAVGPREILTAAHVGGGRGDRFWLDGTSYRAVATITSDTADLMRVTLDRDLPGYYPVTDKSPRKGATLTIAGFGITSDGYSKGGFTWSDDREETWGINRLDAARDGHLWFKFDKKGGTQEATLTPGDSGGAVFITGRDGQLILAGINRGIYAKTNGRSSFGDTSIAVDLASQGGFLAGLGVVPTPGAFGVMMVAGIVASRRRR